jgi:hypothetical protein
MPASAPPASDVTYLDAVSQALMAETTQPDESVDPDHDVEERRHGR